MTIRADGLNCGARRRQVEYAYPVLTHDRSSNVAGIREWMELTDICRNRSVGVVGVVHSGKYVKSGLDLGTGLRERRGTPNASACPTERSAAG